MADPKKIVDLALKLGFKCVAIADHGNISGSVKADKYAKYNNLPILIIISQEVKSKFGDILGLNIKESIPEHLAPKDAIARIHEQGGLAIIAHPFGLWCDFKDNLENYLDVIDGIEILNASVFKGNETAKAFAQKHNLAFTAGSDAHFANRFIGKTWLELPLDYSPTLTASQVIAAIKEKKGTVGGSMASFIDKAIDHPFRSLTKLKVLIK
jgi:predicted metal-dependent phosphoesterase TrpH